MIKKFKLFEEIKRKAPRGFEIGKAFEPFDPEKFKNFGPKATALLQRDDFVVNGNIATCEEKFCTFEIEKSFPDEFTIFYELRILDKDGVITKRRKWRTETTNHLKALDNILNLCAKYHEDLMREKMKDIDPYGEENWEEDKPSPSSDLSDWWKGGGGVLGPSGPSIDNPRRYAPTIPKELTWKKDSKSGLEKFLKQKYGLEREPGESARDYMNRIKEAAIEKKKEVELEKDIGDFTKELVQRGRQNDIKLPLDFDKRWTDLKQKENDLKQKQRELNDKIHRRRDDMERKKIEQQLDVERKRREAEEREREKKQEEEEQDDSRLNKFRKRYKKLLGGGTYPV